MKVKEFASYCLAGFIGGVIYELVVYFSDPYQPDWPQLILRIAVISIGVALFISLFQWLGGDKGVREE